MKEPETTESVPEETVDTVESSGTPAPVVEGQNLSIVGQDIEKIPTGLGEEYGSRITKLDFSWNNIEKVENLDKFVILKSLILDNNSLATKHSFSKIESLDTLHVNNNKIDDLEEFVNQIVENFPNITYLSMLKNPACPNFFTGKGQKDYQRYRYFVIWKLPNLKFLDSTKITDEERSEAKRVGSFMKVAKPVVEEEESEEEGDEEEEAPSGDKKAVFVPQTVAADEHKSKASFGVTRYIYYGKQSEGNRFILNSDL